MEERRYLPAAGHDWFLPLYDPIVSIFGFRTALAALIAQAELQPSHVVLDIGCGTGTLAVHVKQRFPAIDMTGLDPDPKALAIARRKAERAHVAVRFDQGFGSELPYGSSSFDRVFSSMMFHHLPRDDRPRVLAEIRRVLKPGGRLEFLDFAGAAHTFLAQIFHGHEHSPAAENRLLERMAEAGFTSARRSGTSRTLFGALVFYQAST